MSSAVRLDPSPALPIWCVNFHSCAFDLQINADTKELGKNNHQVLM